MFASWPSHAARLWTCRRSMRPPKKRSARSAWWRPSTDDWLQSFVATKVSSRRPPSAAPSTSSAAPYIGEESNTRAPAASAASTTRRAPATASAPRTSNVRHVPIPTTGRRGPPSPSGRCSIRVLEAARVARHVAARRATPVAPARPAAAAGARRRGGEAQAGDDHIGVTAVRVHRDPAAAAAATPVHEGRGVERLPEEAAAVERVADGAGAVVARVVPLTVAAAVAVGLAGDLVRGVDRLLHLRGRAV